MVAMDATDVPIVIVSAMLILFVAFAGTTISHPGVRIKDVEQERK